jgi:hypothetical protein
MDGLSELDGRRFISLQEAARLRSCSVDTLRRHFSNKIVQVSKRRFAMRLNDALHAEFEA